MSASCLKPRMIKENNKDGSSTLDSALIHNFIKLLGNKKYLNNALFCSYFQLFSCLVVVEMSIPAQPVILTSLLFFCSPYVIFLLLCPKEMSLLGQTPMIYGKIISVNVFFFFFFLFVCFCFVFDQGQVFAIICNCYLELSKNILLNYIYDSN